MNSPFCKKTRSSSLAASRPLIFCSLVATALTLSIAPETASACACGCGVFDVGASTMFANSSDTGVSVWLRYDLMDQNKNWEGTSSAPASDNGDKEIRTSFFTIGGQYMFSHDWGVMAELPTYHRSLETTDDGTVAGPAGSIYTGHLTDMGDLEVMGIYTGISPDMSTGLLFGLKLPTGNYTGPNGPLGGNEFDRDSLPGTGSTDIIVGAYHAGGLTSDNRLAYFAQALYRDAVLVRNQYRPGNEIDAAAGLTYDFGPSGVLTKDAPIIQLLVSQRNHDTGVNADPLNSGYTRLLVSPGIDLRFNKIKLYADIELPVYQRTNAASSVAIEGTSGQLVASKIFKFQIGYEF